MDSYNAKNSSTGSLNGCEAVRIMEHYLKEPNPVFDKPSDTTVPNFTLSYSPFSPVCAISIHAYCRIT